jgi:hypothetical protein
VYCSLDAVDAALMTSQNAASSASTGCGAKQSATARRNSNDTSVTGVFRLTTRGGSGGSDRPSPDHAAADARCRHVCLSPPPPLPGAAATSPIRSISAAARATFSSSATEGSVIVAVGLCFVVAMQAMTARGRPSKRRTMRRLFVAGSLTVAKRQRDDVRGPSGVATTEVTSHEAFKQVGDRMTDCFQLPA